MKNLVQISLFIFISLHFAYAQNNSSIAIDYQIKFQRDTNTAEFFEESGLLLYQGGKSLFISHKLAMYDSIKYMGFDESRYIGASKHNFRILKDFEKQDILQIEEFATDLGFFSTTDHMDVLDWDILQDTATISNILCQKAKVRFGKRTWYAWFAQAIPISDGPYKFCGLPGLIVQVHDEKHSWIFTLLQIKGHPRAVAIDLAYLPKAKELPKDIFFKTRKDILVNLVELREAGVGPRITIPGDKNNVQLKKIHQKFMLSDNNWIELYP